MKNNEFYSDDISHGRRIPVRVLRRIYREIKTRPIAPPPACFSLVPLQAPALDAPATAPGNGAAASAFAGAGDSVTEEDIARLFRRCAGCEEDCGGRLRAPPTLLAAAAAVALPEVWHAAVRVALSAFTASFSALGGSPAAPGSSYHLHTLTGVPDSVLAHAAPLPPEDAIKLAARSHLRTLATCAALAGEYGVSSGVDIVVAALCRIATATLQSSYAPAAGEKEGGGGGGGEGGHAASTPQSVADGSMTPGFATAFGGGAPPTRARPTPAAIAAAFAADLRGQIALSAALAIAAPTAQGTWLGATGWHWIVECILRLIRCGLMAAPVWRGELAVAAAFSGGTTAEAAGPLPASPSSTLPGSSPAAPGGGETPLVAGPGDAAAAAVALDPAALDRQLAEYAMASAQYRHEMRQHAKEAAEAATKAAAKRAAATAGKARAGSGGGGSGRGSPQSADGPADGPFVTVEGEALFTVSPPHSEGSGGGDRGGGSEKKAVATAAAAPPPTASPAPPLKPSASGFGGLMNWLFGGGDGGGGGEDGGKAAGGSPGPSSHSPPPEGKDPSVLQEIATSPEWVELVNEEMDEDDDGGGGGGGETGGGGALTPMPPSPPTPATVQLHRMLSFASTDGPLRALGGGSVAALATSARAFLAAIPTLPRSSQLRALRTMLRLAGVGGAEGMLREGEAGSGGGGTALAPPTPAAAGGPEGGAASFLSGMEFARYKAALLPAPSEAPAASRAGRAAWALHSSVAASLSAAAMAGAPGAPAPGSPWWVPGLVRVCFSTARDCIAPSKRARLAIGTLLDHFEWLLRAAGGCGDSGVAAGAILAASSPRLLRALWSLALLQPPVSGAARALIASFLYRLAAHSPRGAGLQRLLALEPGSREAGGVAPADLLTSLAAAGVPPPLVDAFEGELLRAGGGAEPTTPTPVLICALLAVLCRQGWAGGEAGGGAQPAAAAATLSAPPPTPSAAGGSAASASARRSSGFTPGVALGGGGGEGAEGGAEGGAPPRAALHIAVPPTRPLAVAAAAAAAAGAAAAAAAPAFPHPAGGSADELHLHVLELTLFSCNRLAVAVLLALLRAPFQLPPRLPRLVLASLESLALSPHTTHTITLDTVSADAADALFGVVCEGEEEGGAGGEGGGGVKPPTPPAFSSPAPPALWARHARATPPVLVRLAAAAADAGRPSVRLHVIEAMQALVLRLGGGAAGGRWNATTTLALPLVAAVFAAVVEPPGPPCEKLMAALEAHLGVRMGSACWGEDGGAFAGTPPPAIAALLAPAAAAAAAAAQPQNPYTAALAAARCASEPPPPPQQQQQLQLQQQLTGGAGSTPARGRGVRGGAFSAAAPLWSPVPVLPAAPPPPAPAAQPSEEALFHPPPRVLCERTLLAAVTLLCKAFFVSLPRLLAGGGGGALPAQLTAAVHCVALAVDTALDTAWRCAPPQPPLVEALSELARNFLSVTAAEVRAVDEGLLPRVFALLPSAAEGASLRAVALVMGLLAPPPAGAHAAIPVVAMDGMSLTAVAVDGVSAPGSEAGDSADVAQEFSNLPLPAEAEA